MLNHPISLFFGVLATIAVGVGAAGSYAASLGPCMGDAECVAETMDEPAEPGRVILAQR